MWFFSPKPLKQKSRQQAIQAIAASESAALLSCISVESTARKKKNYDYCWTTKLDQKWNSSVYVCISSSWAWPPSCILLAVAAQCVHRPRFVLMKNHIVTCIWAWPRLLDCLLSGHGPFVPQNKFCETTSGMKKTCAQYLYMCCMIDFRWHTVEYYHFCSISLVLFRIGQICKQYRIVCMPHKFQSTGKSQPLEMTKLLLVLFKWYEAISFYSCIWHFSPSVFCFSFPFNRIDRCHAKFPLHTTHTHNKKRPLLMFWKSPLYYLICRRLISILSR